MAKYTFPGVDASTFNGSIFPVVPDAPIEISALYFFLTAFAKRRTSAIPAHHAYGACA